MLDLFSGTGSIGRVFADRGYTLTRVHWDQTFDPDIVVDLRKWDYWHYPPLLSSSGSVTPCTEYSTAMTSRMRDLQLLELGIYMEPGVGT